MDCQTSLLGCDVQQSKVISERDSETVAVLIRFRNKIQKSKSKTKEVSATIEIEGSCYLKVALRSSQNNKANPCPENTEMTCLLNANILAALVCCFARPRTSNDVVCELVVALSMCLLRGETMKSGG